MKLALSPHAAEAPPQWLHHLAHKIVEARDDATLLQEVLVTALALTQATAGYIQWFNALGVAENYAVHSGFTQAWLEYFNGTEAGQIVSDAVQLQNKRVTVANIAQSPMFSETAAAPICLKSRVQALQCTPIFDPAGTLIGVLCTGHAQAQRPTTQQLLQLDQLLAYTAGTLARVRHATRQEASAQRFRLFFSGMQEGAAYCRILYNAQGQITDWLFMKANPALERIFGVYDLAGKYASNVFPALSASMPELFALFQRASMSSQTEDAEIYLAALNKWLQISVHCPAPAHIALLCRDVTHNKQRDAMLKQAKMMSEALNRINVALHSSLDIGDIVQRVLSEGASLLASQSAAVMLLRNGQWIVSDTYRLPEPSEKEALIPQGMRHADLALQTRKVLAISNAQQDLRVDREIMRRQRIQAILVAPLIVHGQPLGVLQFQYYAGPRVFTEHEINFAQQLATSAGIALDNARMLNDFQQQAQAFRASEQRLQLALEAAGMGMWDWDLVHDTVQWNKKHYELFGIAPENFHNRASEALAVIHPEDVLQVQTAAQEACAKHGEFYAEFRVMHPDQSLHWIASKGQRIEDGDTLHMSGICHDITDRKRAEQEHDRYLHQENMAQMQRLDIAGEFTALLAHQLNQPLSAIRSFAEAGLARLRQGKNTPENMQEALHDIVQQSERAAQSIRDLRKFLARQPQELVSAYLNSQVHAACALMNVLAEKRKVRIHLDLDKKLPMAMMRPAQIEQVLVNLLSNALDSISESGAGSGNILIKSRHDAAHRQLVVTLRDSGPGLNETSLLRVFDPLYTTKQGGIGLGLAICKSIIEDHGGHIWAEAGPGGCFIFTLPEAET